VRCGFDLILTCWCKDYLHCAEGTGNHAGFTADTFLLVDLNAVFDMTDCAIWATPGARRILAVVAGYRAALMLMFDHRNSGLKMPLVQYVLLIIVGHYASDLTGMASQALLAIGHNKTIHGVLLFWWQNLILYMNVINRRRRGRQCSFAQDAQLFIQNLWQINLFHRW
jgi:hypothetical protein